MSKKKEELDVIRKLLRSKGLRATPARIAVINVLTSCRHPISHLEVTDQLEKHGYEKSTIFRALGDLTDAGLARKMELGDHVWRFERIEGDVDTCHPHLLCVDCGSVKCLDTDQVVLKTSKSLGQIEQVLLKGHCDACR
jgi:Fur family transcriptional regulator, ferric uptake regulator